MATYLFAQKTSTQTITTASPTVVTSWAAATYSQNANEWNPTTGVFTATKAGVYSVAAIIQFSSSADSLGVEYSLNILKNGNIQTASRYFTTTTTDTFKSSITGNAILSLGIGDTISIQIYHNAGANRTTHGSGNYITIQQLPMTLV